MLQVSVLPSFFSRPDRGRGFIFNYASLTVSFPQIRTQLYILGANHKPGNATEDKRRKVMRKEKTRCLKKKSARPYPVAETPDDRGQRAAESTGRKCGLHLTTGQGRGESDEEVCTTGFFTARGGLRSVNIRCKCTKPTGGKNSQTKAVLLCPHPPLPRFPPL